MADAIALAYQTNPALLAERADVRAVDERFIQARAALGPSATIGATGTYDHTRETTAASESVFGPNPASTTNYKGVQTDAARFALNQPLYSGGQLGLEIQASQADVLAARQTLREREASVLGQVITAYADVLLNRDLVLIAGQNLDLLRAQAKEIDAKFAVKEVTATDQAQTQARLIAAEIDQVRARDALRNAEAEYVAAVGQSAGNLAPLPELPGIPSKVDTAFDIADQDNPNLQAARYTELASRVRAAEAKAADGLQIGVGVSYGLNPLAPYLRGQSTYGYDATVSVSKTLFTAGAHTSRVRQALESNNRDNLQVADSRRQVIYTLARAWNDLASRRAVLTGLRSQLVEEGKAQEGSRLEARIGIRSTIDTLNAEQEYQATKVSLLQSFHDEYLTRVTLLTAMGHLRGEAIDPDLAVYRPETGFQKVSRHASLPWEGLVQSLDQIATPKAAQNAPTRDIMGANRPVSDSQLPPAPSWSDIQAFLAPPRER